MISLMHEVKTGDILAWKRNRESLSSDLLIRGIRLVTDSEYGHVGVATRIDGTLFVVEATLPSVKLSLVRPEEEVFHIASGLVPNASSQSFLLNLVGFDYGLMDAVRGALGKVSKRDDKWQCAEIVITYLQMLGVEYTGKYRPGDVVEELVRITGQKPKPLIR